MREIKFRAWDKKEKRILTSVGFSDSDCGRRIICEAYMIGGGESYSQWGTGLGNMRFILMQYTGLKDKKGKEIYSGDIVKLITFGNEDRYIGIVDYVPPTFILTKVKKQSEYNHYFIANYDVSLLAHTEVIGNIWENPKLLKEKL